MTYAKIKCFGKQFKILSISEDDHIIKNIQTSGTFYEFELLNYLRLLRIKGRCAIDVGANIGNHSIFFSAFLAENVISVEANSDIIPALEENLSNNNCNHEIVASALGAESGCGELSFPLENNVGAGRITKGAGNIKIITLDNIAPNEGVFLVKIDVEGMEMDVLQGGCELITSQRPDLVIEASTEMEFSAIDKFLRPFGYRSLSRWNSTPTYHFSCSHGFLKRFRVAAIRIYVKTRALTQKICRRLALH